MAIDAFEEVFNIVYIAKKLHSMGKYDFVTENFYDVLDYDCYYEDMYNLVENLFDYHYTQYYENRNVEVHVLSDPAIVDFYILAGKHSRLNGLSDDANPYIEEARQKACELLNFSYCLDWMLIGHTEPTRPYHSRLGLFISQDDYVDLGCLSYALVELYEWFENKRIELSNILNDSNIGNSHNPREKLMAA